VKQYVQWGAGPRAVQCLLLGAKARAVLDGSVNVSCDYIRKVAPMVLRHRVLPQLRRGGRRYSSDAIAEHLLKEVKESTAA